MESQITHENHSGTPEVLPKKKVTKRRFTRLTADELQNVPGANVTVQKKVETGPSYFFEIAIPLSCQMGSPAELQQANEFLALLQGACGMSGVGSVISVSISGMHYQITIKVQTVGEQVSHVVPLNFVFEKLNTFFADSTLIRNLKPEWLFKVMGTTVADGKLDGVKK